MVELFANNGDLDQGLLCLPVTRLGVSNLQWVRADLLRESLKVFQADNPHEMQSLIFSEKQLKKFLGCYLLKCCLAFSGLK